RRTPPPTANPAPEEPGAPRGGGPRAGTRPPPARKECPAADHEPARSQLDQLCKDSIEVTFGAGIQNMKLQSKGTSRCLHLLCVGLGNSGIGWVDKQRHDARRGE